MSTDRRGFLGAVVATGLVATGERGIHGERGRLGKGLSRSPGLPHSSPSFPQSASWDVSWPGKITGAHRAVFDIPEVSAGLGLIRTLVWFKDYAEVYSPKAQD